MGYKQFAVRHGFLEDLYEAQNKCCYICKKQMPELDSEIRQSDSATIDHVTSRYAGGCHKGNMLLAHGHCNSSKSNRPPTPCELTYLAIVNHKLGWNGHHYMNTAKGVELYISEKKRAQELFEAANAIIVLPITRESAIRILKSKKYYRRWKYHQQQKLNNTLYRRLCNVPHWISRACVKFATTALEATSRLGSYCFAYGSRAIVQSHSFYSAVRVEVSSREVVV